MARRAERVARAGGSFLGGIANNPGIVILGLVLGGLFIFRDKISEAFAGIGEGFGNIDITLPEIKFPDFPEIKFPDFPEFPDFSNIFAGFQKQIEDISGQVFDLQGAVGAFGAGTTITKEGVIEGSPPTVDLKTQEDLSTLFGELRPQVFDTLINIGVPLARATEILSGAKTFEDLQVILNQANTGIFTQLQGTLGALEKSSMIDIEQAQDPVQAIKSFLVDQPTQQFIGGGVSFVGGSIFETPIANLTLSQIIDKFNVTASQAANILAIAKDDFGDFDFGTNTGLGGFDLPGISGGNVSDPQFQGMTPEQIALFLTGGNIQNF